MGAAAGCTLSSSVWTFCLERLRLKLPPRRFGGRRGRRQLLESKLIPRPKFEPRSPLTDSRSFPDSLAPRL